MSPDLTTVLDWWETVLRSQHRPGTADQYLRRVRTYLTWCERNGRPPILTRDQVILWTADQLETCKPITVINRHTALRVLARWLVTEDLVDANPMAGLESPTADVPLIEPYSTEQIGDLVATCRPRGRRQRDRPWIDVRDELIIRLLNETGMRSFELRALLLEDLDLKTGLVRIRESKNHRGRRPGIGPATINAAHRWLQRRGEHCRPQEKHLIVSIRGGPLSYDGLRWALAARAEEAGLPEFHMHRLRHTAGHRWLAAGGSESGAMATFGWSPEMLHRYTRARAEERAIEEARRLNLGDV